MDKEHAFSIWAPDDSPWSRWTKPVLFAHLDAPADDIPDPIPPEVPWAPPAAESVALVLDLPGPAGVAAALALAARGYRPAPLYNALPLPVHEAIVRNPIGWPVAAVDMLPVIAALKSAVPRLAALQTPGNAPPAFLLDSRRSGSGRLPSPDYFDNRSICFTTDFPSAAFLLARGIRRTLLVRQTGLQPQPDLARVLRRWQEAGIALQRVRLDTPGLAEPFQVARPAWFGALVERTLAALGLLRARKNGFGQWVGHSAGG